MGGSPLRTRMSTCLPFAARSWRSVIRPYRESDRAAVVALTVAAFQGVSIDHNLDSGSARSPDGTGGGGRAGTSRRTSTCQAASWRSPRTKRPASAVGYVTMDFDPESRIGWIHNLAVDAGAPRPGAGPPADRACPRPLPCRRHDRGQDRDPRAERRSAATSTRPWDSRRSPARSTTRCRWRTGPASPGKAPEPDSTRE